MKTTLRRALPVLLLLVGVLALLGPAAAQAQQYAVDQGSLLLAGTAGFHSSGREAPRFKHVILNPTLQYFVTPGLALGGELLLTHAWQGDYTATTYGIGPAATLFFGKSERTLYPYISTNLYLSRHSSSDRSYIQSLVKASIGLLHMLTRAVGLHGELFYQRSGVLGWDAGIHYGLSVGITAFVF